MNMNRFIWLLFVIIACVGMWVFRVCRRTAVFLPPAHQVYHHEFQMNKALGPMISSVSVSSIGSFIISDGYPAILSIGKNENIDTQYSRMLSIGPGSLMFTQHGPITVLKNVSFLSDSGLLILNDNGARNFSSSCLPDSVYRIPILYNQNQDAYVISNISYQLLFSSEEPRIHSLNGMLITTTFPSQVSLKMAGIIDIPPLMVQEIIGIFNQLGASQPYQFAPFYPCDYESLMARLPLIIVTFLAANRNQLVLYPDDYVEMYPPSMFCRLIVNELVSVDRPLGFNPLRIPNVNLHIASDHIEICDSVLGKDQL